MNDKSHSRRILLSDGVAPYQVQAEALQIGEDLVVMVAGGKKPHVGAVAVGIPRPSLAHREKTSATASVFTMAGHKEDELALVMARGLAAALKRNVVITVGIHVDNISAAGIKGIEQSCHILQEKLIMKLSPAATEQ